ncbi:MAG: putative Zn-dependent protease, partial [Herbinix sp.]|nr:putative Zn-dependent protease [Herbinix sp.]
MKTVGSEFLTRSKPYVRKLIELLSKDYKYVSVLGTDTRGKVYRVGKTGTEVIDVMLAERGFVVRLHNGVNYSEYSFNEIDEDKLTSIVADIKDKLHKVAAEISVNTYALVEEEELAEQFFSLTETDPESISAEDIIGKLTEIKDLGCSLSEQVVNFRVGFSYNHVSKIFLSAKKDLEQSYTFSEA